MQNSIRLRAIRGASCVNDTQDDMQEKVSLLYETILKKNKLNESDIVSIQFTLTQDIHAANPAFVLRKAGWASEVPLFCAVEPDIDGAMPFVVRILITAYLSKNAVPVYLNGAEALRKDLIR